jgi:hypothetical protein
MRPRRGFALLAALWLVVAIAAIALQFSLEARERRMVGILASERGIQRAAALGGLALMQARLEEALRLGPTADANPALARLRATDPWFGADSVFSGPADVDSMPVNIEVHDLGEKLNINRMSEVQLQTFFSFCSRISRSRRSSRNRSWIGATPTAFVVRAARSAIHTSRKRCSRCRRTRRFVRSKKSRMSWE